MPPKLSSSPTAMTCLQVMAFSGLGTFIRAQVYTPENCMRDGLFTSWKEGKRHMKKATGKKMMAQRMTKIQPMGFSVSHLKQPVCSQEEHSRRHTSFPGSGHGALQSLSCAGSCSPCHTGLQARYTEAAPSMQMPFLTRVLFEQHKLRSSANVVQPSDIEQRCCFRIRRTRPLTSA